MEVSNQSFYELMLGDKMFTLLKMFEPTIKIPKSSTQAAGPLLDPKTN